MAKYALIFVLSFLVMGSLGRILFHAPKPCEGLEKMVDDKCVCKKAEEAKNECKIEFAHSHMIFDEAKCMCKCPDEADDPMKTIDWCHEDFHFNKVGCKCERICPSSLEVIHHKYPGTSEICKLIYGANMVQPEEGCWTSTCKCADGCSFDEEKNACLDIKEGEKGHNKGLLNPIKLPEAADKLHSNQAAWDTKCKLPVG